MLLMTFILVVIFLLVVLFSAVHISIQYTYEKDNQYMIITVFLLKIRFFKKKYDLKAFGEEHNLFDGIHFESFPEKLNSLHQTWKEANRVMMNFLMKVRLHHFSWVTAGGTGDAFTTGIASGSIWSVKGIMTGYFLEKVQLKCKPYIYVEPNFQEMFVRTDLDCIVSIRFGQAILAIIKLTRRPIIIKKPGGRS